jgi:hypothetical protein
MYEDVPYLVGHNFQGRCMHAAVHPPMGALILGNPIHILGCTLPKGGTCIRVGVSLFKGGACIRVRVSLFKRGSPLHVSRFNVLFFISYLLFYKRDRGHFTELIRQ